MTDFLPCAKTDEDKTKDIEQVTKKLWFPVEICHFKAVVHGWPRQIESCVPRVVDPFADGKEDAAQGYELDCGVADSLQRDGQRQGKKKCAEYEHGLVPIVNNELRKRVSWLHFGLLPGVCCPFLCGWRRGVGVSLVTGLLLLMISGLVTDNHTGSWLFISTIKQMDIKKYLHAANVLGYASLVAGIPAIGICSPETKRTPRPLTFNGGFFVSEAWRSSFFGRAMRGAFGLAGALVPVCKPAWFRPFCVLHRRAGIVKFPNQGVSL